MNRKHLISLIMITALIVSSALLTACGKEEPEVPDGQAVLILDLESDSDNGIEWEVKQDGDVFNINSVFIENEAAEEGSGEVEEFTLIPAKGGSSTIHFTNPSTETTYTYVVDVNDELDTIEVKSSEGEAAGAKVEAPEMIPDSY